MAGGWRLASKSLGVPGMWTDVVSDLHTVRLHHRDGFFSGRADRSPKCLHQASYPKCDPSRACWRQGQGLPTGRPKARVRILAPLGHCRQAISPALPSPTVVMATTQGRGGDRVPRDLSHFHESILNSIAPLECFTTGAQGPSGSVCSLG